MESILYLVHRIPYPPNKGDKIRSYHLLKYLSKHYKVYLGSFIDDVNDWQYQENVNEYCEETFITGINPRLAKCKSLSGFVSNKALTIPYYYDRSMKSWVDKIFKKHNIKRIVIFSSAMAQYVEHLLSAEIASVIDFVDVDSDKWKQYAENQTWLMSWVYNRESKKLLKYESNIAEKFSKSYFVSKIEANLFVKLTGNTTSDIDFFNNGVDYDYFNPVQELSNPYQDEQVLVFTGAMDYWANVDGIVWFVNEIFPKIVDQHAKVKLYIVGVNPLEKVQQLHNGANIIVTGKVDDIRPYIQFASVVVVPLRLARGVQNKVLEGMAYNKPIVATRSAIEGIEECNNFSPLISNNESRFSQHCVDLLSELNQDENEITSRECILSLYDWDANLGKIQSSIERFLRKSN